MAKWNNEAEANVDSEIPSSNVKLNELQTHYFKKFGDNKLMSFGTSENPQSNVSVEVTEGNAPLDDADIESGETEKLDGESSDIATTSAALRRNPFDGMLLERLENDLSCTPGLFQRKKKKETTFQWAIEHIAQLRPAEIEERETEEYFSPGFEAKARSAIDKYWEKHYIPSPDVNGTPKSSSLRSRLPTSALAKQEAVFEEECNSDEESFEEESMET